MSRELVTEEDVIQTYSEYDINSCNKYNAYLKLLRKNPTFGYKKCAKILKVPQGRVRWWHTKTNKRGKPTPLKTMEKLKEAGLLPFTTKHKYVEDVFRILGTLFGDAGIDKRLNTMAFISAVKENIDLWQKDLLLIFPFAKEKMNLIEGGEYGHSYNIRTFDRAVIRFFIALGAPVGDKVIIPYSLPKRFQKLPKPLQLAFFDGLLSCEVSIPRYVFRTRVNSYFKNFSFSLSKHELIEKAHSDFLLGMRKHLHNFGIEHTPNLSKDNYKNSSRKDGKKSFGYRIFFRTSVENVEKFNTLFPLKYCIEKKQKLEKELLKAEAEKKRRNCNNHT